MLKILYLVEGKTRIVYITITSVFKIKRKSVPFSLTNEIDCNYYYYKKQNLFSDRYLQKNKEV